MNYLHQNKTMAKARDFSDFLNKADFQSVLDIDGTRDYLSKIDIHTAGEYIGKINVYYSPKKDSYKITCQSISINSYKDVLKKHWQDFQHGLSPEINNNKISAYVDGSFLNKKIGYGALIMKGNTILHEISGKMDEKYEEHHQIGGELKAVTETVSWCNDNNIKDLHIYYDYKGIEMWARGKWKAKKELTQKYQAFMIKQSITFHFHKVAAHTGNRWNEHADMLAKKGSMS
ncbi:MAG: RNase H family protein [Candidatus Marinimicrobia bacterium]|nr:RNase H family protein [Candidatus Neomarinimicrobiota bacterium]